MKKLRPPVKANMIIVRGKGDTEVRGESWTDIQHRVYTTLAPRRMEGLDAYFELVLLVPGMAPIVREVVIYGRSNAIAIPEDVVHHIGG